MRRTAFILLILCLGCKQQPPKINIKISLTDSNRSVKISGLDQSIITEIGRDTSNYAWESLFAVYKMPADTDLMDYQNAQPGNYKVQDSVVVFTPDTSFKKGQVYFLRYYQHDEQVSGWQYIRGKKRPGGLSYKDLIFRD
ncbi:MAG TPA: hypothetical protein VGM63_17440 [Mucilaginibacter sp.]|jgi:hypothetical protein